VPEGDRLYRYAALIRPVLEGRPILAARAHGPGPVPQTNRIVGAVCTAVRSQGKNLIISFDNGLALRGHLRMNGTWHVYKPGETWRAGESNARLVLEVEDAVVVNFFAPVIELNEERALAYYAPISKLGPDLLADDFDPAVALVGFRDPARARLTIGDALMDQRIMAGVGNIWKHETLFRCGLNPWRRVEELDDEKLAQLIRIARELLRAAAGKPDNDGKPQRRPVMCVYGRSGTPCRRCGTLIRSARQGVDLRFTAWCPHCQPVTEGQAVLPQGRGESRA
jgi:endonuclease-8